MIIVSRVVKLPGDGYGDPFDATGGPQDSSYDLSLCIPVLRGCI